MLVPSDELVEIVKQIGIKRRHCSGGGTVVLVGGGIVNVAAGVASGGDDDDLVELAEEQDGVEKGEYLREEVGEGEGESAPEEGIGV